MKVHQLCARIEFGDAVSNHVLAIDRALGKLGFETDIFANTLDEFGRQVARPDSEYPMYSGFTDDLLIYHYSVYCPNYRDYLASRNRRILIYHNITPPEYFAQYDVGVAEFCRLGRDLLGELAVCELALGDSEYNRRELVRAGFDETATGVLPIFVDYEALLSLRGKASAPETRGDSFKVLFVGRAVPNKRLDDVVRAFYYYNRCINASSELFLVGAPWVDRYDAQLRWLIDSFGLAGSVHTTGRVSDSELAAYYDAADVFLSMSEHEGFGVPLIESMAFDVPVVAYSSTAVPYTLEGAGLTFTGKDFPLVGELLELLRTDMALRDRVISTQRDRLLRFSPGVLLESLEEALGRLGGALS